MSMIKLFASNRDIFIRIWMWFYTQSHTCMHAHFFYKYTRSIIKSLFLIDFHRLSGCICTVKIFHNQMRQYIFYRYPEFVCYRQIQFMSGAQRGMMHWPNEQMCTTHVQLFFLLSPLSGLLFGMTESSNWVNLSRSNHRLHLQQWKVVPKWIYTWKKQQQKQKTFLWTFHEFNAIANSFQFYFDQLVYPERGTYVFNLFICALAAVVVAVFAINDLLSSHSFQLQLLMHVKSNCEHFCVCTHSTFCVTHFDHASDGFFFLLSSPFSSQIPRFISHYECIIATIEKSYKICSMSDIFV